MLVFFTFPSFSDILGRGLIPPRGNRFSQTPEEIGLNDDSDSYGYLAFSNQYFLEFDKFECEKENILENIFRLLGLISF